MVVQTLVFLAVAIGVVASMFLRIALEYERAVIFRLGRLSRVAGPGLFFVIPVIDRVVKMDVRIVTLDVPTQEVMTRDNVPAKVNAVVYFRVLEPGDALVKVDHFVMATSQVAQTTLRAVVGHAELDEVLAEREKLNNKLQAILDESTDPWGVKVTSVEIKDVELPAEMKRAMAKQAEAERDRRAKIIAAQGESEAAQKIFEAAEVMAKDPMAIQLRFLQTLREVSTEKNSTMIIPTPLGLLNLMGKTS